MNNKVVYTSLVGNMDRLMNPSYVLEGWDYICFSNDIKSTNDNNIWDIRPIPYHHKNPRRLSRFVKIKPHEVLQQYEYSLWLDSSIEITNASVLARINELINNDVLIALIPHPYRSCIYDEAKVCIDTGKERSKPINELCKYLKLQGYPVQNGLFENGVMLRKHNDPAIVSLNNQWWDLYMKYSQRDQLSLGFLMWENKINCKPFFEKGISIRNVGSMQYHDHTRSIIEKIKLRLDRLFNKIF